MTLTKKKEVYEFVGFRLDRKSQSLSYKDQKIPLAPKAAQLLLLLLDRAPNLVSRDELRSALWSDSTYIEFEGALNACVRQVRIALGESASEPQFIETLPKRGYRFFADIDNSEPHDTRNRSMFAASTFVLIVVGCIYALFFTYDNHDPGADMLVVLPTEGASGLEMDPIAGYGIAMLVSEQLANLNPGRLSVINNRSIRSLIGKDWDPRYIAAPDYIVRTRLEKTVLGYQLMVDLDRNEGHLVASYKQEINGDLATVMRASPELIVAWVNDELRLTKRDRTATNQEVNVAYDNEYVKGMWHLETGSLAGFKAAIGAFDKILASSPNNRQAMDGKLVALTEVAYYNDSEYPTQQTLDDIESLALEIIARADGSAKGYLGLGFVRLFRDWQLADAINNIEAALMIDPHDARTRAAYAGVLAASGDTKAAVSSAEIAERLDPAAMAVRSDRCWYLIFDGRYKDAFDVCNSALELEPDNSSVQLGRIEALAGNGQYELALETALAAIRQADPSAFSEFTSTPKSWAELGCMRAAELLRPGRQSLPSHYQLARYFSQCGNRDEILRHLELSFEKRERQMLFARTAYHLDVVRNEPRFRALLERLP